MAIYLHPTLTCDAAAVIALAKRTNTTAMVRSPMRVELAPKEQKTLIRGTFYGLRKAIAALHDFNDDGPSAA